MNECRDHNILCDQSNWKHWKWSSLVECLLYLLLSQLPANAQLSVLDPFVKLPVLWQSSLLATMISTISPPRWVKLDREIRLRVSFTWSTKSMCFALLKCYHLVKKYLVYVSSIIFPNYTQHTKCIFHTCTFHTKVSKNTLFSPTILFIGCIYVPRTRSTICRNVWRSL